MTRRRKHAVLATLATLATGGIAAGGCNQLLGNEDGAVGARAGGDASSDGGSDDGSTAPEGSDAPVSCGDITSDPKNCGRCGRDCLGGECVDARCRAVLLVPDAGAALYQISADEDAIYGATYDKSRGDPSPIVRVSLADGTVKTLYQPASSAFGAVLAGKDHIYFQWSDLGANIARCPKSGCTDAGPEIVASPGQQGSIALGVVDGVESLVYSSVGLYLVPFDAGAPIPLDPTTSYAYSIAPGSHEVFWSTYGVGNFEVRAAAADDAGARVVFAPDGGGTIVSLATDDTHLFYSTYAGVRSSDTDGGNEQAVSDETSYSIGRIVLAGDMLYWLDANILKSCPWRRGCVAPNVSETVAPISVSTYAVTSKLVVYVDLQGRVWKLAR